MKTPRGRFRESVAIVPDYAGDVPVAIEVPRTAQSTFGTNILTVKRDPAESDGFGNPNLIEIDNNGGMTVFSSSGLAAQFSLRDGDISESIDFSGRFIAITADPTTTDEPEAVWVNANFGTLPNPTISFYKKGMLKFSGVALANADINSGANTMFFDSTNGAPVLKFKGKTQNGTVVTLDIPMVANQTYAASNVTTDRTYDANSTTIDELADVLGTLIADLRAKGLVT